MEEIKISSNDKGQRIDRFLMKYLSKAPRGFIFKMLRKKNIKLNNKKVRPEDLIDEGDRIQLYLADETIEKFKEAILVEESKLSLDIVYEDSNLVLINKPAGVLSHADGQSGENIVDGLISYLMETGQYDPEEELTFKPSIANRLDRNTSGLIIGAKNYQALKDINENIREFRVRRYYKTIVKGRVKEQTLRDYLYKNKDINKVEIKSQDSENDRYIETIIRPLAYKNGYSLLEVELITGRPHQIRAHLESIGHPIIGDLKYGDRQVNRIFKEKYGLEEQFLHGYKVGFEKPLGCLEYLDGREFIADLDSSYGKIEDILFK